MPSFLQLQSPVGFGPGDIVEIAVALFLAAIAVLWRPFLRHRATMLIERPVWCAALFAVAPVALRLLLLPRHPVPVPDIYDEFGHLFVADTLRHFRLANPAHVLPDFFETFFILQRPTYSAIYPIGQGLVLALGWTLFGLPWAGVLLATAAFCGLCYWMLRGWVNPTWAAVGATLAVIEFGPLNPWMNCYWGGASAATAGCLVFGALPRLRLYGRTRDAILLAAGLSLHLLVRPYESIFLFVSVVAFFAPALWDMREKIKFLGRPLLIAALLTLPALGLTLLQNKQVTGSWTTMPYVLSQYQYGVPSALTFQPNPVPHNQLTPEQQLDYRMQSAFHGPRADTLSSYLLRLEYRVRFYRFFFLPPLYIALLFFLPRLREPGYVWVAATGVLFALGSNFFPVFEFHYIAACTCLFILMSVAGLQWLAAIRMNQSNVGLAGARLLVALCAAHFVFWYGTHLFENESPAALQRFDFWTGINHRGSNPRAIVNSRLTQIPGRLLIFVRYWPQHIFQREWVYNRADIDTSRIVWARDLGVTENEKLLRYFPGRNVLLLEPDAHPPKLTPYLPELIQQDPAPGLRQ